MSWTRALRTQYTRDYQRSGLQLCRQGCRRCKSVDEDENTKTDRIVRDIRSMHVRVISWGAEKNHIIQLDESDECFSSLKRCKQYFWEVKLTHELTSES